MNVSDPQVRDCLGRARLGFVATVSPGNAPNVSPKGTIVPWGDDLIFADIRSPNTVRNIKSNPAVEISVVDPLTRRGFRFRGAAELVGRGSELDRMVSHYRDMGVQSTIRAVVRVRVDSTESVTSPLYDLGLTEEEITSRWRRAYLES